MKICPYCAEEIQDAAIVCQSCGRDLRVSPDQTSALFPGSPTDPGGRLGDARYSELGNQLRDLQAPRVGTHPAVYFLFFIVCVLLALFVIGGLLGALIGLVGFASLLAGITTVFRARNLEAQITSLESQLAQYSKQV